MSEQSQTKGLNLNHRCFLRRMKTAQPGETYLEHTLTISNTLKHGPLVFNKHLLASCPLYYNKRFIHQNVLPESTEPDVRGAVAPTVKVLTTPVATLMGPVPMVVRTVTVETSVTQVSLS